jgi:hypothetical protein
MPVVYLDMGKDDPFRRVRHLINKGILKKFRAIFLYLPGSAIARELKISEDEMNMIIDEPHKYPFVIFFRIGALLNVTEWNMLQLIYNQTMQEKKEELENHFADLLKRNERRLKKKRKKKIV